MSINNRLIKSNAGGSGEGYYGVRYTGTGTTQDITGFGFQPDIIWIKSADDSNVPNMTNIINGTTQYRSWSNTNDYRSGDAVIPISDGITVTGGNARTNASGVQYDVYAWYAGNQTVSNNDGNRTTTVCAAPELGISVVRAYGNGQNGQTFGHGLSQAPEMIITEGSDYWAIAGTALGLNRWIPMNSPNDNIFTDSSAFQAITDTTFGIGTNNQFSTSWKTYLCFHSVPGFSQIGTFQSTGGSDVISTSFDPKFWIGNSTNCGFSTFAKNKYMGFAFQNMASAAAPYLTAGLILNTGSFTSLNYYNNHTACGSMFYATFGNENM